MRKLKRKGPSGYFTLQMLDRDFTIRKGIEGIDPDPPDTVKNSEKWYQFKERKWILKHREKKQLSTEEIKRRSERMKSIRKMPSVIQSRETTDLKGVIARLNPDESQSSINGRGSL